MADSPQEFYEPEAAAPKKKPGRPPKVVEPQADVTKLAASSAVDVSEGVTASAELAPNSAQQEGETLEQSITRIRQLRAPFGVTSQKLAIPPRPGYHRHWFNDVAGRIDEAIASGWAHVKDQKSGQPMKRTVGSGRDGGALIAFAMELPEVFWQEEMDARHKQATEKLESIKKNPFASKPGQAQVADKGKFYDPTEGSGTGPLQIVTPKA